MEKVHHDFGTVGIHGSGEKNKSNEINETTWMIEL